MGEDIILGGRKLWLMNGRDGSKKKCLLDFKKDVGWIRDVFADRSSGLIYSVSIRGNITIWKEHTKAQCWNVEELADDEAIKCMTVLPTSRKIVLGTTIGRLLVIDIESEETVRIISTNANRKSVRSCVAGLGDKNLISVSNDGRIRVWDMATVNDSCHVLDCKASEEGELVVSRDGRLLASTSKSGAVRLWDLEKRQQVWRSPKNVKCHHNFFGRDGLFYTVNRDLTPVYAWHLGTGGRDVSLMHTSRHEEKYNFRSIRVGHDYEVLLLSDEGVIIWDTRDIARSAEQFVPLLRDVGHYATSEDGATIATFNRSWNNVEVRDVQDLIERRDRVVSSFYFSDNSSTMKLAVTNDRRFIAYSGYLGQYCTVQIVDARSGVVSHTLSDLHKWALSISSNSGGDLEALRFNSNGSVVSANAAVQWNALQKETGTWTSHEAEKSLSWNVSSGELLDEAVFNNEPGNNIPNARLLCECSADKPNPKVSYQEGNTCFTTATLERSVKSFHYCSRTGRLWILGHNGRGPHHIDLIADDTDLGARDKPALPVLPEPPVQRTGNDRSTGTGAEEVYDVFISHAGPDKCTIAEVLYEVLVALGLKVFLDKAELHPGQNAAGRMIDAMWTAKIAVVILSPEFAARKWTLKELMCFLERYHKGGESEVVIIPVFYRLTLEDCRDRSSLFEVKNGQGENVFVVEGFLQWMSEQSEVTIGSVLKGLQSLRNVTGIENKNGVTDGSSDAEKVAQRNLVGEIAEAVVQARKRIHKIVA